MKNIDDFIYYIAMSAALFNENGETKGNVNVSNDICITYSLSNSQHPFGDPFGCAIIVYNLDAELIYKGESIRLVEVFKRIGRNDKNFFKEEGSLKEKYSYLMKKNGDKKFGIFPGVYEVNKIKRTKLIPSEVQEKLSEYTKSLLYMHKEMLKRSKSKTMSNHM